MVEALIAVCVASLVLVAALIFLLIRLERELRLMAQFLEHRSDDSNARIMLTTKSKGASRLAQAINDELDNSQAQHIKIKKSQQELQENLEYLSHDIRTPLTGAQGYAQLLDEENDPVTRRQHLESIKRRLIDLRHLLDQLFVFTQVRSVDYALELSEVDANAVLSDVLVAYYPQFVEKELEPVIEFEDESHSVMADMDALHRVFQNLVGNALRYAKGSFTVCQKGETFSFINDVNNPDALDKERIFERFYQGEASRTTQGSGLGLAIVEQLAKKMEAEVAADIEGDIITITLSMKQVQTEETFTKV